MTTRSAPPISLRSAVRFRDRLQDRMTASGENPSSLSLKAGLSRSAVRDILSGKSSNPSFTTVVAFARVLDLPVAYLMGDSDDDGSPKPKREKPNAAGRRVARIRQDKGMTQNAVSIMLQVHWITISKLERGEIEMTESWANRLAGALECDPIEIWLDAAIPSKQKLLDRLEEIAEKNRIAYEEAIEEFRRSFTL